MKTKQAPKRKSKRAINKKGNAIVKGLATFLNKLDEELIPIAIITAKQKGNFMICQAIVLGDPGSKLLTEFIKAKAAEAELEEEENGKATDDDVPF